VARRRRDPGHCVDLTDFFNKNKLTDVMAPATIEYYAQWLQEKCRH
jgi:multiple sugar transport system substrate-binding protein